MRKCQMRPNGIAAPKGFGLWRVVAYEKANKKRILLLKGKKHVDKAAALGGLWLVVGCTCATNKQMETERFFKKKRDILTRRLR
jgi:hypothetical protein